MSKTTALSPLKLGEWCPVERAAWIAASTTAAPLAKSGFAAKWRPATIRSVERGYGIYLAWLAETSRLQPGLMPIDRVTVQLIERFLDVYAPGRAETTVASVVRGIAYVVRATHPPDGLSWLTEFAHRLSNSATPSRPKLPRMASTGDLNELGFRLMDAGLTVLEGNKAEGALLYRNGLMISTLITRPARLTNFSSLRLGHNFHHSDGVYEASFARKKTKKENRISFAYPEWMSQPFDVYFRHVRPTLLGTQETDAGWLWISRRGTPLRPTTVTTIMTGISKRHLGRPVSPHLYRDCAATDIALIIPEQVGITKDILGHATLTSSQKSYNQAKSYSALKRWGSVLQLLTNPAE